MNKTFGIGIMGLGTVGSGTVKILVENNEIISIRKKSDIKVVRILEKRISEAMEIINNLGLKSNVLTDDFDEFLNTEGLDIVVELIGGTGIAKDFIMKALNAGKSVVTANKDLMAIHGKELLEAANNNHVDLKFEAAVAGGIPIIEILKNDLVANNINSIMGIVNGTTNYILTKMYDENVDFDVVLREAQELGYAESDPTSDICGFDAARKVAILASIAYNSRITLDDVYIEGIDKISSIDIDAAKKLGYVIKLLGIAREDEGEIEARVHPVMIPVKHPLSSVSGTFNAVFVDGDSVGETMFYGRGAGDLPTGSAVVSDICKVVENIKNTNLGIQGCTCYLDKKVKKQADFYSKFYIRMQVKDSPGVLSLVCKILGDNGVSIASVIQKKGDHRNAELLIITHHVKEGLFIKAKNELLVSDVVLGIDNIIRVEED